MVAAVPIGPRVQRFAMAASAAYLDRHGRPQHPRDLLSHSCLRGRFTSGAMTTWQFECNGEVVRVDPSGPAPRASRWGNRSCGRSGDPRYRHHFSF